MVSTEREIYSVLTDGEAGQLKLIWDVRWDVALTVHLLEDWTRLINWL